MKRASRGGCFVIPVGPLALAFWLLSAVPLGAQVGFDSIPSNRYYTSLQLLQDGDFRDAGASFLDEARGGIKNAQGRWIDSICYHAMAGETFYQMGQLEPALLNFTAALELYKQHSSWMLRLSLPPEVQPAQAGARMNVPWGATKRNSVLGQFSHSVTMSQGQINNNNVVRQGGVVQNPIMFSVDAVEIIRATTLALRRRGEILGPLARCDELSAQLVTALSRRPGPPNHWSSAWIDLQLGSAYVAAGNPQNAVQLLERAMLAAGQYDHPLTATAMVELGRVQLMAGDFASAAKLFEEATYAAVNFNDLVVLEEAFRYGHLTHVLSGSKNAYPPLALAIGWAKAKGHRTLAISLTLMGAESLLNAELTQQAGALLSEVRSATSGAIGQSTLGTRYKFLSALAAYQAGSVASGDASLAAALASQKTGSFWMFQLNMADQRYAVQNDLTDRMAMGLYETLLRDPTPADWLSSPMEAITYLTTPHHAAFEHWFEAAMNRSKEQEKALEIADMARRHRFYSSLNMGGRVLALRWLLEGPAEMLGERATLQRQEIFAEFPVWGELNAQIEDLRVELGKLPRVCAEQEHIRKQSALFAKLAAAGALQETLLRQIAVRREPAEMIFPPLRKVKDLQAMLPDGQALLTFFQTSATSRQMYAFMFTRERYFHWRIDGGGALNKQLATMLRDLGCVDGNMPIAAADLQSGKWKKSAVDLREALFARSDVDLSAKFNELVVVPDGNLWYLPFEALPVGQDDKLEPLIARVRVRYAATMGLSTPYSHAKRPGVHAGLVVGKVHPQDDAEVAQSAVADFKQSLPDAEAWPAKLLAPSASYRQLWDQLIVLDDVEPTPDPYDWSPAQVDRGKPGSSLDAWLSLPWGSPRMVVLPGYHSSAESGMRKTSAGGNDLFLSVCGLMATGTRTVLISRWRLGGQTSINLVREFTQEAAVSSPADAWQRSVALAREAQVDPSLEPRLKGVTANGPSLHAEHPFFWAGYMLADCGVLSEKVELAPAMEAPKAMPAPPPDPKALPPLDEPDDKKQGKVPKAKARDDMAKGDNPSDDKPDSDPQEVEVADPASDMPAAQPPAGKGVGKARGKAKPGPRVPAKARAKAAK